MGIFNNEPVFLDEVVKDAPVVEPEAAPEHDEDAPVGEGTGQFIDILEPVEG